MRPSARSMVAVSLAVVGCAHRAPPPVPASAAAVTSDVSCDELPADPLRHPAPSRLVAIGDLHGDLGATRAALRVAGAIDEHDAWIGGELVLVQTGDVFDRGDDELEIEQLFDRLALQAEAAGGRVHRLLGNHELMNVAGDFRYVTEGGFADYDDGAHDPALAELPEDRRGRAAAFRPGAPAALNLARRNVVEIVGDTVFVHAGVLPRHVDYGLERINREVACWLAGGAPPVRIAVEPESPVCTRAYATEPVRCDLLHRTLAALDVRRMVIGHTPQTDGITSDCDGALWRIDVGLSAAYGGPVEVLELAPGAPPRALEGERRARREKAPPRPFQPSAPSRRRLRRRGVM